jgi:DNA mismatch endonuclease (patch repair protein)
MARLISPPASSASVRRVMRGNRSRDTGPERIVRRLLSRLGYRYRLCSQVLPGKPDIVFAGRRKVIFVHGCFWHRHARCPLARPIRTNLSYWDEKLARNKARDVRNRRKLRQLGWDVLVVRECELHALSAVQARLCDFLREN